MVTLISTVLVTPFTASLTMAVYFDLRVRKEGFDLWLLAQKVGGETPEGGFPAQPGAPQWQPVPWWGAPPPTGWGAPPPGWGPPVTGGSPPAPWGPPAAPPGRRAAASASAASSRLAAGAGTGRGQPRPPAEAAERRGLAPLVRAGRAPDRATCGRPGG